MRRIVALIVAAVGLSVAGGCGGGGDDLPPLSEAKTLVSDYLSAIETADAQRIETLTTPGNDARSEIDRRVKQYAGRRPEDVTVAYSTDFGGKLAKAVITERTGADDPRMREELILVPHEGNWYIAFGGGTDSEPRSSTDPG